MQLRLMRRVGVIGAIVLAIAALVSILAVRALITPPKTHAADDATHAPLYELRPQLCTETAEPWNSEGQYTGHDEPETVFYSTVPGSGDSTLATLTLPTDPVAPPLQNGTGSTWNFMLRPTFWFGMAMCDDQSAPNPGAPCTPDSDKNIHRSLDPHSADYIGLTPGTAFMEMQFYPPGWGPVSCTDINGVNDGKWCSAMTIDSFQSNSNTGINNNPHCVSRALGGVGIEPVNYAIVTKSGVPVVGGDPFNGFGNQAVTTSDTLEYNNGDVLTVNLHDTPAGFQVVIHDLTTGQSGSMTASIANGFGHPKYDPTATSCTDLPYAFHPMYSTSTIDTRVYWAAHAQNIAFSDEVGHFEYCNAVVAFGGGCKTSSFPNPTENTRDRDEAPCFPYALVDPHGVTLNPAFTGCLGTDVDFDGPEYQTGNWPGTTGGAIGGNVSTPVRFSSPLFTGPGNSGLRNYQQAGFETDLPRIEGSDTSPNNNCQRHVSNPADPHPGMGCINPPNGATFYPIYSTTTASDGSCIWQEGGGSIPGTTNNFGGTSTAEYGGLQLLNYPAAGFTVTQRFNNFNNTLTNNPCLNPGGKVS